MSRMRRRTILGISHTPRCSPHPRPPRARWSPASPRRHGCSDLPGGASSRTESLIWSADLVRMPLVTDSEVNSLPAMRVTPVWIWALRLVDRSLREESLTAKSELPEPLHVVASVSLLPAIEPVSVAGVIRVISLSGSTETTPCPTALSTNRVTALARGFCRPSSTRRSAPRSASGREFPPTPGGAADTTPTAAMTTPAAKSTSASRAVACRPPTSSPSVNYSATNSSLFEVNTTASQRSGQTEDTKAGRPDVPRLSFASVNRWPQRR